MSVVDRWIFADKAFTCYSRTDRERFARLEKVSEGYRPSKGSNLPQRNPVVFMNEEVKL